MLPLILGSRRSGAREAQEERRRRGLREEAWQRHRGCLSRRWNTEPRELAKILRMLISTLEVERACRDVVDFRLNLEMKVRGICSALN